MGQLAARGPRPAAARQVERPVGGSGTPDIPHEVVVPNDHLGVIARVIGIADLDHVGVELTQGLVTRRRAHPVELLDAVAETIGLLLTGAPDAFMSEVARRFAPPELEEASA